MTSMLASLRYHLPPLFALTVLVLAVFFRLVLNPCYGLYSEVSDLPCLNMPIKLFLAESSRATGEIPRWNPHVCAGMPFVHDSQTAAFYPLHVVLYVLPPEWMQATLSWLTVLHVMIAGWCMYAYAYSTGLGRLASFTAGGGYMLSGKWLLHIVTAGHYPMVALAWVPLILLFVRSAIILGSLSRAIIAGVIYGLLILGSHPQVTFYTGLFLVIWTIGAILESAVWVSGSRRQSLARAVLWGAGTLVLTFMIAVLLAAIQLVPNFEVVPYTSRSLGMESGESLLLAFWKTLQLFGPPVGDLFWENQGGLGVIWVVAAFFGVVVGPQRARFYGIIAVLIILYGIGGSAFLQSLPGFNLFRCPSRILWYVYVPISLLVAEAVHYGIQAVEIPERRITRARIILLISVALGWTALGLVQARDKLVVVAPQSPQIYWPGSIIAVGCIGYLILRLFPPKSMWWMRSLVALLVAELVIISLPFMEVRDYKSVLPVSECVMYVKNTEAEGYRCLDRDYRNEAGITFTGSGPIGLTLPLITGLEPVRGWHSIDVLRYKEYLAFISDRNKPFGQKDVVINFPIINKQLLDALSVRYIVQPSDPEFAIAPEKPLAKDERYRAVFQDEHPIGSYNVMSYPRITKLPPYTVYENPDAFPRAWLVGEAVPAPERAKMLETLKTTDLRRTVLLEGLSEAEKRTLNLAECESVIRQPNRLVYKTRTDEQAFLVFSEVWFPGWRCFVDGTEVPIYRANHAFRAVRVPAGEHEVVMVMDPASLRWGKWISLTSLAVLLGAGVVAGGMRLMRRKAAAA